jgi:hypothetical protein
MTILIADGLADLSEAGEAVRLGKAKVKTKIVDQVARGGKNRVRSNR